MPLYSTDKRIIKAQIGKGTFGRNTPVWFLQRDKVYQEPQGHYVTAGTLYVFIPYYVQSVYFDVAGSQGGGTNGGLGGRVTGILHGVNGRGIFLVSGAMNGDAQTPVYNAADIRLSQDDLYSRVVVAGGGGHGGGGGNGGSFAGGAGGGLVAGNGGQNGAYGDVGGRGATQESAGDGGTIGAYLGYNGANGGFGMGGAGGPYSNYGAVGGAGGAGWYGGGGGPSPWRNHWKSGAGDGGGGGSSYTNELCTDVVHYQGAQAGNGYVHIWW